MPNWKKVLLSGSKASLYDITASNLPNETDTSIDIVSINSDGHFQLANRQDVGGSVSFPFTASDDGNGPSNISVTVNGNWASTGTFAQGDHSKSSYNSGTSTAFVHDLSGTYGSYTGPLFLQEIRIAGDFDGNTTTGELASNIRIGGHQFVTTADRVTTSYNNVLATVYTASDSDSYQDGVTYNASNIPSVTYEGLDTDNSNFELTIPPIGNSTAYSVQCNNGLVDSTMTLGSGVNFGNVRLVCKYRKPNVSYNTGVGFFTGVNGDFFAAELKHVGSVNTAGGPQDPNGLHITLAASSTQGNNSEFIRFSSIDNPEQALDGNAAADGSNIESEAGSIINSNGVATLSPPSDKRLKKDIIPISSSLNNILSVDPVHYTWKNSNIKNIGFIAQDLYEYIPEAVIKGDENTIWKLN